MEEQMDKKLEEKAEEKLDEKLEEKVEEKSEEKPEESIEVKTDEKINEKALVKYEKHYSGKALLEKLKKYGKLIGVEVLYKSAQLYYVLKRPDVPTKVKVTIMGALGYLISPLDFIPDVIPILGYTDDAVAIGVAFLQAQAYIDEDVKEQAKKWVTAVFGIEESVKL